MLDFYGRLSAEYYDLTKPVGGNHPLIGYHLRRLAGIQGRVLEAGVGTGRLLVPLLEAGITADGVDVSEHMLAYCRRNCESRGLSPGLYQAPVQRLALGTRYQVIIMTGGSFALLHDHADAVATVRGFAEHLVPRGTLFLDLDVHRPDRGRAGLVQQNMPVQCRDGALLTLSRSTELDFVEQVENTLIRYERIRDGRVEQVELEAFTTRWFGKYELVSLLREAGFGDIDVCSDYAENAALHPATQRMCFTALRR